MGVAIVHRDSIHIGRTTALSSLGLEHLYLTVWLWEGSEVVQVYHSPLSSALTLLGVADFISAAVLRPTRLLIVWGFNMDTEFHLPGQTR